MWSGPWGSIVFCLYVGNNSTHYVVTRQWNKEKLSLMEEQSWNIRFNPWGSNKPIIGEAVALLAPLNLFFLLSIKYNK